MMSRCRSSGTSLSTTAEAGAQAREHEGEVVASIGIEPGRYLVGGGARLRGGVEAATVLQRPGCREHHLGSLGRELASRLRGAGLDDDGPALDGAGDVERPL